MEQCGDDPDRPAILIQRPLPALSVQTKPDPNYASLVNCPTRLAFSYQSPEMIECPAVQLRKAREN